MLDMTLGQINWVGVAFSAMATNCVGWFWFSSLFGQAFMRLSGWKGPKPTPAEMRKSALLGFLIDAQQAALMALLYHASPWCVVQAGLTGREAVACPRGFTASLPAAAFVMLCGANQSFACVAWERKPVAYWLLLVGHRVVSVATALFVYSFFV